MEEELERNADKLSLKSLRKHPRYLEMEQIIQGKVFK